MCSLLLIAVVKTFVVLERLSAVPWPSLLLQPYHLTVVIAPYYLSPWVMTGQRCSLVTFAAHRIMLWVLVCQVLLVPTSYLWLLSPIPAIIGSIVLAIVQLWYGTVHHRWLDVAIKSAILSCYTFRSLFCAVQQDCYFHFVLWTILISHRMHLALPFIIILTGN